jgi:hypothetical protein
METLMSLEKLNKSLADMSRDERLKLVHSVREDRQVSKTATTKKVARKQKTEDSVMDKFGQLSPEEQAAVLKLLEGS